MEHDISFMDRLRNGYHRQHPSGRVRGRGLIAWLLPMVAVFALASVSGGQETTPEPNNPLVVEETDNPNGDLDKDNLDKDDQDKDVLDKDKKDQLDETMYSNPTTSSPIALSADNTLLWVVNPTDNSVSVIRTDTKHVLTTIKVGKEPQSVALDPRNRFAYVANAASNNVSVIRIHNPNPDHFKAALIKQLLTGAEPWNVAVSPDGRRVFVANSSQDTITVINARNGAPSAMSICGRVCAMIRTAIDTSSLAGWPSHRIARSSMSLDFCRLSNRAASKPRILGRKGLSAS